MSEVLNLLSSFKRYEKLDDFQKQLHGYQLTTAEILYHMPDHPSLLQTYLWQELDIAPKFPVLKKFLDFWESNLEGKLHSVQVAHKGIISPATYRYADGVMSLH